MSTRRRRWATVPAGLTLLATTAALAPSTAAAAPFTCEASVLSGTIATAPPIEPLVTGRGDQACRTASVGLPNLSAPLGAIGVNALAGATSLSGDPKRQDLQSAVAGTSIADVRVGALGSLGLPPLALPLPTLPAQNIDISAITGPLNGRLLPVVTPLGGLLGGVLGSLLGPLPFGTIIPANLALPTSIPVDINAAVQPLLQIPTTDVLGVKAATTLAGASCLDGKAVTAGSRSLGAVTVLGQSVNLDTLGDQPIVDTQSISLANLDPNLISIQALTGLPAGPLLTKVTALITAQVLTTLKALPPIPVPVDLLRVQVTPGSQAKTATSLTQNGPAVKISALGQPVVDLQLGQAKVGTAGVDCTPPKPPTKAQIAAAAEEAREAARAEQASAPVSAAAAALACTTQRLVLTDVVTKGARVRILGVADKRYAGKTVKIVFEADGKAAARATVKANGEFSTTAKLPSKKLRASNKARYRAQIGREKSRNLKLARRLFIDRTRASNGRVRLVGHVSGPLGAPVQTITLTRRVSCKKSVVIKRFKPRRDGRFSVLVSAPEGARAQVYRFGTKVRRTLSNRKLFPTFTLPTGVDLT